MADAADLKSAGVKSLWVRVPLPALVENKYDLDNRSIRIYVKWWLVMRERLMCPVSSAVGSG